MEKTAELSICVVFKSLLVRGIFAWTLSPKGRIRKMELQRSSAESVFSIIGKTHLVYGTHFLSLVTVQAIAMVPIVLLYSLVLIIPHWSWFLALAAATIILVPWTLGATYAAVIAACRAEQVGAFSAYRAIWGRRLPHLISTGILIFTGTLIGLLLLIIPGVIFLLRYGSIYPVVVVAEGVGGFRALRRCHEITRGEP